MGEEGRMVTSADPVLRPPAEAVYAEELERLAAADKGRGRQAGY